MHWSPLANSWTFWLHLSSWKTPYLLVVTPPYPPSSRLWQSPIYFLSLCICLFHTVHVNEIILCEVFCVWLLSCIMFSRYGSSMLQHVGLLYFCIWLKNSPLYGYTTLCLSIHPLKDIWVISILNYSIFVNNSAINFHVKVFT